jgi:hypothetical protein
MAFFRGFLFRPSHFFDYADPLLVTSSESPHVIAVLHQRRASTTLSYNTSKSQYSTICSEAAQNLNLPNSEASPGRSRWCLTPFSAINHPSGQPQYWPDGWIRRLQSLLTMRVTLAVMSPRVPSQHCSPTRLHRHIGHTIVRSPIFHRSRLIDRAPSLCVIAQDLFQAPAELYGRRAFPLKIM